MDRCPTCGLRHLPTVKTVRVVATEEAKNPAFRRAVRQTLSRLEVPASKLVQHLLDRILLSEVCYVDEAGDFVTLDLDFLEPSDVEDDADAAGERILLNERIATLCTAVPEGVVPRAGTAAIRLLRAIGTLVRAAYPFEAMCWDAVNDNTRANAQ